MKPGLAECDNAVIVPHIASASFWTRAGMVSAVHLASCEQHVSVHQTCCRSGACLHTRSYCAAVAVCSQMKTECMEHDYNPAHAS